MAEKYITRIRTTDGDKQIDYKSLANLPEGSTIIVSSVAPANGDIWIDTSNSSIGSILKYKDPTTKKWVVVAGGESEEEPVDAYTKEESLSRSTKTSLGLSNSATPDDAIRTLQQTKAPMYSYGTNDLQAGVSALESGKLHFIYE